MRQGNTKFGPWPGKKLKMIKKWKLTAKRLDSRLTSSSESQLQMVWGTGLAKARLCPPGSLVTQQGKLRNRQIVVAHIAAPFRGWTSRWDWCIGCKAPRFSRPAVSRWPGALGDCSKDIHQLVQICDESKVDHLSRSRGSPELEGQLSVIVSQYKRLLSTCVVRAQAQSLLSRVGVISPQVREAARAHKRGRMETQLREERRANWMAGLRGPGSARGGRCHALL